MATGPTTLEAGTTFAGLRIEGVLGRGGMAVVYEATELALDRRVAVKVLAFDLAEDSSFRERFRREQVVMAGLDHPNILPVYGAGEVDHRLYLVMRLVPGGTLKDLIRAGALAAGRATQVVGAVADALDAAHEAGLVHRDVKPQNILIGRGDTVYLADFGLAIPSRAAGITAAGQFVGTIDYIAPEQIRGEPTTAMADVYALGCVLYEGLTGRVPFERPSDAATLYAHMTDPPPRPSAVRADLAPAFDAVVARALAKAPDERYPSAGALARDAAAALRDLSLVPPPPSPAPELGAAVVALPAPASPPPGAFDPSPPPPAPAPPPPSQRGAVLRFRLRPDFRYVHQPLAQDDGGIPLLGNEAVVTTLKERILHSSGGSFLLTGFRGVGKTTVISRALEELRREGQLVALLPVTLNVARPRTVEELLFEIIRRVFEALKDEQLFDRMAPRVQRELLLAYARTSLSFNQTQSRSRERGGAVTLGLPSLLETLAPKLEMSRKTTDSLATQASFLAYTDADVEHDFLRIVGLVERGEAAPPPTAWRRLTRRGPVDHWHGKLVVVIDELDKLTVDEDGMRCIQALLTGLKNLLTARGVHFLFVAGPDLHDVALRESRRGNSVYESVFGWQLYVPCVWDATDRLLEAVIAEPPAALHIESLRDYLRFKSRGVPRLLLMELNSFVRWEDDGPLLVVAGPDRARVEFYAALERVVSGFVQPDDAVRPFALPVDEDRWRLGAYYLVDWILQSEGTTFTVAELVSSEAERALDPLFSLSPTKVEDFLAHLVKHDVVEQVRGPAADQTYYGDVPSAQEAVYRLARDVGAKLSAFARVNERERADLGDSPRGRGPWGESAVGGAVGAGRYELVEELDRGGLGRVFRARDKVRHREVAVKVFDGVSVPDQEVMRERFARKAGIARSLDHPNIVPTFELLEEEGRLCVVMGLVAGTSLEQLLFRARLTPGEAVRIARSLADALDHVHARGIARLDLKPSSVLVDERLRPVIVDLGLAKVVGDGQRDGGAAVTRVNAILGTPAYAAPEQVEGRPVDIRADIHALGLLLFEMITGRRARPGDLRTVLEHVRDPIDLADLEVSPPLRDVLHRALAPAADDRFPDPAALRAALEQVPESRELASMPA